MFPHLTNFLPSVRTLPRRTLVLLLLLATVLGGLAESVVSAAPAAAAGTWSQFVSDSYQRVTHAGFGRAQAGGSYSRLDVRSRVAAGRGLMGPIAAGHSAQAVLPSATGADEQVSATFAIPAAVRRGYGTFLSVQLRRQHNGDAYVARVRVGTGGTMRVSLGKFVKRGTFVSLTGERAVPGTARSPRLITVTGRVTGQVNPTLSVRAFVVGTSTPSWQLTATDRSAGNLAGSGHVGVYVYRCAGAPTTSIELRFLAAWRRPAAPRKPSSVATPPVATSPVRTSAVGASKTVANAGAAPLGQASYSLPGSGIYVSPSGSDSTGTGSTSAPFATIRRALSGSTNGSTIVLRAGLYNENLFISKSVTIEAYPGEVVWMDGSIPVSGWTRSGSVWTHGGWSYQFDHSASTESGSDAGGYVNPAYPMAAHPDQVFANGSQLTQVAGTPTAGQFSVNYASRTITVGSDPNGVAMRASNLPKALVVGVGGVTLRGFGVRNYATSLPDMGTIYLGGSGGNDLLQDLVVRDNAGQGISVYTSSARIDHVDSWFNGMTGIHATQSPDLTITGCDLRGNNTQHFNSSPAAGAIKVGRLNGVTITNNYVHDNYGITGIWTDENVSNFKIANNVVDVGSYGGSEYGILTELSNTGIVAGNVISNADYGYTAFDTGNVQIYNNTLSGNSVWDIGLSQDDRYLPGHSTAAVGPTSLCPWVVRNISVADNDFSASRAMYEFYALDKATKRPADQMAISLAGNQFLNRTASRGPWPIGWGNGDIWTPTNYPTVRAWEVAHGLPVQNTSTNASATGSSVLVGAPAAVAAVLGVPVNSKKLGAY